MKNSSAVSAVVGAAFFALPYMALSIPLAPSIAIGAAAYAAGELVFKKEEINSLKKKNKPLYLILENAKEQNKHIKSMIVNIDDNYIKADLHEINVTVNKVIEAVEKYPERYKKVKKFFEYYLPVTVKLVDRFDDIENQEISSSEAKKFYKSTGETITEMKNVYKKFLNNLYQSDMDDANVEIKVLNSMLKSDGLDDNDINVDKESKDE